MDEYINREEAIKELREVYEYEYPTASGDFDEYVSHDVPNVLRNMPSADVQPVKRGKGGMTLDEAIKHCLEVVEKNEIDAITYKNCKEIKTNMYEKLIAEKNENDCHECAADHRQLAEWLQELRAYRKLRICGNCRHYVYGTTHFGECHVTSDIEPCVVGIDQTACDTFFDYKDFRNGVEKPKT